jgi:hypothetical protein
MFRQLFLNGRLGQRVGEFLCLHLLLVASLGRIEKPHSTSMLQSRVMTGDQSWEPSVSVQEVAGQDYCTERGEAKQDKAQDSVDEAEEDRTDAVGDEAHDDDQCGKPGHQASGNHQDSPPGRAIAQD